MSEVIYQERRFEIEPATLDDVVGIGEAHLQSWLETYPSAEYGVDESWIKEEFSFLVQDGTNSNGRDNGIEFRRKLLEANSPNTLYKVVKDEKGKIQGFLHVTRGDDQAELDAIYLTNELKGTGVAHRLMDDALEFTGGLPIHLQVVVYNERAINFYKEYGFETGEIESDLFHGKLPILNMTKPAESL